MAYENIDVNIDFTIPLVILAIGFLIGIGIGIHSRNKEFAEKESQFMASLMIPLLSIVVALGFTSPASDERKELSRAALESNIVQKYDVEKLDFELGETNPWAFDKGKRFEVVVEHDGELFEFLATYDAETDEPTLIDPPTKGGELPTEAVTADSLIRN